MGWHHLHGMRGAGPDHGHPRHHPMHWHAWTHPIGVEELLARHAPGHVASVALPLARKVQVLAARAHPVAWAHVQARVLRVSGFWHRRESFDSGGKAADGPCLLSTERTLPLEYRAQGATFIRRGTGRPVRRRALACRPPPGPAALLLLAPTQLCLGRLALVVLLALPAATWLMVRPRSDRT